MKESEEISQRTFMYNPWTQMVVWYGQRKGGAVVRSKGKGGGKWGHLQ